MSDQNAARTLDNIREGGSKLLVTARTRLAEVGQALDEGRFVYAQGRCADLFGKVKALADAEAALGALAHLAIIRAEDLREGMTVGEFKIVGVRVDRSACPTGGHEHVQVTVKWHDDSEEIYDGAQEIAVAVNE